MPDSRRLVSHRPHHGASSYGGVTDLALTAAAQTLTPVVADATHWSPAYDEWQNEAWAYYHNLGEFNYGVEWFGEALSRVRLLAAEVAPEGDEPTPLTTGPATELVERLAGGTDAQSALLKSLATQLSVPGEGYLIGREVTDEDVDLGVVLDAVPDEDGRVWTVQPRGTLRRSGRSIRTILGRQHRGWDLRVDDTRWTTLPDESLVVRVWDRDEYRPWRAFSPARPALPIMREIDMYNRHIMASLVSRVALNGFILIPDEVTLPANPNYENSSDPFFAELLDIMRSAIKNPGAPSAAAPVPLRVPAQYVEHFRHLTFATPLDEKIWTAREGAIKRLATTINLPQEVLTGMGDTSHWSSWQLEESAIKIHIAPKVEIITQCLTQGYLYPMLKALGQPTHTASGNRLVVWYDTSQLTQRPDRSDMAVQLNDRFVINDTATRRETGFAESDAPTDEELKVMLLRTLVKLGTQLAGPALEELTGVGLAPPVAQAPVAGVGPPNSGPGGGNGGSSAGPPATGARAEEPPTTRGVPPPAPDEGVTAATTVLAGLARRVHGHNGRAADTVPGRTRT